MRLYFYQPLSDGSRIAVALEGLRISDPFGLNPLSLTPERIPGPSDPRVKALSDLLRTFPHHSVAARKESFRNPDGVAFKLQNLRQVATGRGLGNVSRTDRATWSEFGSDPRRTQELAALIRLGIEVVE